MTDKLHQRIAVLLREKKKKRKENKREEKQRHRAKRKKKVCHVREILSSFKTVYHASWNSCFTRETRSIEWTNVYCKGYSTIAWTPFFLKITMRWTCPLGALIACNTSCNRTYETCFRKISWISSYVYGDGCDKNSMEMKLRKSFVYVSRTLYEISWSIVCSLTCQIFTSRLIFQSNLKTYIIEARKYLFGHEVFKKIVYVYQNQYDLLTVIIEQGLLFVNEI